MVHVHILPLCKALDSGPHLGIGAALDGRASLIVPYADIGTVLYEVACKIGPLTHLGRGRGTYTKQ